LHEPLQHSLAALHPTLEALQHVLADPHVRPPQQSVFVAHAFVTAEQPQLFVALLHTAPKQQSVAVVHGLPATMQPHVPFELHIAFGPQQSAARAQVAPMFPQPHFDVAPLHVPPQHCVSFVQGNVSLKQHFWPRHVPELQQSWSVSQDPPLAAQPQVFVALLHLPLQQLNAEAMQSAPSGRQAPH
jgi:hypothetical protein